MERQIAKIRTPPSFEIPNSPHHQPTHQLASNGHEQSEIPEMAVLAGDRRQNPPVPSGLQGGAEASHDRASPRTSIRQDFPGRVAHRRTPAERNVGPAIDDGDPGIQPGKGDAQVAQYSTVQTIPTASHSRLRHLALLCDHADIAPRSIFFSPPPPLNRRASGHLERTVVPPLPLPSSVPVAGSFEIAWFGFRFPRFRSFATL